MIWVWGNPYKLVLECEVLLNFFHIEDLVAWWDVGLCFMGVKKDPRRKSSRVFCVVGFDCFIFYCVCLVLGLVGLGVGVMLVLGLCIGRCRCRRHQCMRCIG